MIIFGFFLISIVNVRLEVKVVGKPKPEGKWLKEGEEILPSNEFIIESFEDGTSVLTLPETYPDDVGEIVYEAQNPLGVATTVTHLLVETVEGNTFLEKGKFIGWVEIISKNGNIIVTTFSIRKTCLSLTKITKRTVSGIFLFE